MRFIVLLASVALSLSTYAQVRIPGYIVTSSGDTVKGFIVDKNNDWRVSSIQIASTESSEPIVYQITDLKTIYFKPYNEFYFTETVDIDKKPIRMQLLESAPARKIVKEMVLLKLLAKGKIDLYYYKDENSKEHFFVSKDHGKIDELAFVRYNTPEHSVASFPYYIQTLKSITSDCSKVKVRNPGYELTPLKKIIELYNECFAEKGYVLKREKIKFSFGVIMGGAYSRFKYDGSDYASEGQILGSKRGAASVDFGSIINPIAGLNFEILSKRPSNPFVPGLHTLWQQTGEYKGDTESNSNNYRHYSAKFSYVTAAVNIKYYPFKQKGIPFYLKAAVGYDYLYKYSQQAELVEISSSKSTPKQFMDFKKSGLNFSGGSGISLNRFTIEINYQHDSFYGMDYATASLSSFNLLLGFKIL